MWTQFSSRAGALLIGSHPVDLLAQLAFLFVISLLTIYQILRMRRDTVVILSHRRLITSLLLSSAATLACYQVILMVNPVDHFGRIGGILAVLVALLLTRYVTMIVVGTTDGGRSIKDVTMSEGGLFNCNWPLISRCTNQSLFYLCVIYATMKGT
jgi:hypothetical protein